MRHIDAKTIDTLVEPEAQNVEEFLAYLWIGPIQIRLCVVEQVQVPVVGDSSIGKNEP